MWRQFMNLELLGHLHDSFILWLCVVFTADDIIFLANVPCDDIGNGAELYTVFPVFVRAFSGAFLDYTFTSSVHDVVGSYFDRLYSPGFGYSDEPTAWSDQVEFSFTGVFNLFQIVVNVTFDYVALLCYFFTSTVFTFIELLFPIDYSIWETSKISSTYDTIRNLTQYFLIKFLVVISFVVIIRSGTPRYRFDYLTKLGWLKFLGFSLCILIVVIILFFIW